MGTPLGPIAARCELIYPVSLVPLLAWLCLLLPCSVAPLPFAAFLLISAIPGRRFVQQRCIFCRFNFALASLLPRSSHIICMYTSDLSYDNCMNCTGTVCSVHTARVERCFLRPIVCSIRTPLSALHKANGEQSHCAGGEWLRCECGFQEVSHFHGLFG